MVINLISLLFTLALGISQTFYYFTPLSLFSVLRFVKSILLNEYAYVWYGDWRDDSADVVYKSILNTEIHLSSHSYF